MRISLLVVVLSVVACGDEIPRTQVTAVVQAEPGVESAATRLEVVVMGGAPGGAREVVDTLAYGAGEENPLSFPVRIAIVPQNGDASRTFEVAATAFDADGAIASASEEGAFEAQRSLTLDVWLRDGSSDGGTDGGMDASPDASGDAAMDSSLDAADSTTDAPVDAPADAPVDASDAGPGPLDLYNVVFVTSMAYQGGDLGGLAGADDLCQMHATDAGLPRPTSYVALLSTSGEDARDRLGTSRGWVRVDGLPFADEIADIAAGEIFYPIMLSETGVPPVERRVMTGSAADLTQMGANCTNWADLGRVVASRGDSREGSKRWVELGAAPVSCSTRLGLYCFGTGMMRELIPDPAPAGAALAFVSNGTRNGRMGLSVLDSLCSSAASTAGLSGVFRALITPNGGNSAVSRFTFTGPWYRPDGILVASTRADVASETLESAVSVTADGFSYGNFRIWVGADSPADTASTEHCRSWNTTLPDMGQAGWSGSTYDFFTGGRELCGNANRVLCFEDRP